MGPQRPATLRPFERKKPIAPDPAPQDESAETLAELESHLERLTGDIPETSIDDIPRRLQRYVIGVPRPLGGCFVRWPVQWFCIEIITSDGMIAYVVTCDILLFVSIIFSDHKVFFNL